MFSIAVLIGSPRRGRFRRGQRRNHAPSSAAGSTSSRPGFDAALAATKPPDRGRNDRLIAGRRADSALLRIITPMIVAYVVMPAPMIAGRVKYTGRRIGHLIGAGEVRSRRERRGADRWGDRGFTRRRQDQRTARIWLRHRRRCGRRRDLRCGAGRREQQGRQRKATKTHGIHGTCFHGRYPGHVRPCFGNRRNSPNVPDSPGADADDLRLASLTADVHPPEDVMSQPKSGRSAEDQMLRKIKCCGKTPSHNIRVPVRSMTQSGHGDATASHYGCSTREAVDRRRNQCPCKTRRVHGCSRTTRISARNAAHGCWRQLGQSTLMSVAYATLGRAMPVVTDSRRPCTFHSRSKPPLSALKAKRPESFRQNLSVAADKRAAAR